MSEPICTPGYDRVACLSAVLEEMEKYLASPADILWQLGLIETGENARAVFPLLFDAKVLHARCLYEFFHNTRTLSKEGGRVYNGINILCTDYGYRPTADKRRFYRLKTELDEQAVHLTVVRDGTLDKGRIMVELDGFLLPDITGFLTFIHGNAEYDGFRPKTELLLSKTVRK